MSVSFPGSVDDTYNTQNGYHSQVHDIIYDIKSYNTRSKQYKRARSPNKSYVAWTADSHHHRQVGVQATTL